MNSSEAYPILRYADVHRFQHTDADRELFDKHLRSFVPPNAFDAHAHLFDLRHLAPQPPPRVLSCSPGSDRDVLLGSMRQWMGDRMVADGLYFPFPVKHLDCRAANEFLAAALKGRSQCRGLMMVRPQDDPAEVEATLVRHA